MEPSAPIENGAQLSFDQQIPANELPTAQQSVALQQNEARPPFSQQLSANQLPRFQVPTNVLPSAQVSRGILPAAQVEEINQQVVGNNNPFLDVPISDNPRILANNVAPAGLNHVNQNPRGKLSSIIRLMLIFN